MKKQRVLKGLAGAAALAGATQAYGAIVVLTPPANIVGNDPTTNSSTTPTRRLIDLDGNGSTDLQLAYRSFNTGGYTIQQSFVYAYTTGAIAGQSASATSFYAYEIPGGTSIGPSLNFGNSGSYLCHVATNVNGADYGFWYLGDRGFIGFSFLNANTNQINYGYIEVETDPYNNASDPGGLRFFSLAYDNTGAPITAGATAVPEPSTLAALAFGGIGLAAAAYRRRKQSAV